MVPSTNPRHEAMMNANMFDIRVKGGQSYDSQWIFDPTPRLYQAHCTLSTLLRAEKGKRSD